MILGSLLLPACTHDEPWVTARAVCSTSLDPLASETWAEGVPFDQQCADVLLDQLNFDEPVEANIDGSNWAADTPTMTANALWFLLNLDVDSIARWSTAPTAPVGFDGEWAATALRWDLNADTPWNRVVFDWIDDVVVVASIDTFADQSSFGWPWGHLYLARRPGTPDPAWWASVLVHEAGHASYRPHLCEDGARDVDWSGACAVQAHFLNELNEAAAEPVDGADVYILLNDGFCFDAELPT